MSLLRAREDILEDHPALLANIIEKSPLAYLKEFNTIKLC
jgi:hypothetical protein